MAPDGNISKPNDFDTRLDLIDSRINELQARLIEQEHRFWHSLYTVIKSLCSKDKSHLSVAVKALTQNLIPSVRTITLISGGTIIGILTLYLMFLNNQLVSEQNYHLRQQNYLNTKSNIEQQLISLKRQLYEEKETQTSINKNKLTISAHSPESRSDSFSFYLRAREAQDKLKEPELPKRQDFITVLLELLPNPKYNVKDFLHLEKRQIEINLPNSYLNGISLYDSGLDLSDYDLNLAGATLYEANFRQANLINVNLWDTDFQKADLTNAILEGIIIDNANLRGSNLKDTNLENSIITNVNFQNSSLYSANAKMSFFAEVNMKYSNLENSQLQNSKFYNSNLQNANFSRADLQGASFINSNLQDAILDGADLLDADLSRALGLNCKQLSKVKNVHLTKALPLNCK